MSGEPDVVQRYLDELAGRLHGPASHIRRVLDETEAHLYEATDASAAADRSSAQAEAVARFGSPELVAAAANQAAWTRARRPVLRAGVETLMRLGAAGLIAMGVTGLVARLVAAATSTATVYGFPATTAPPASSCRHWLTLHPGAAGCRQAATLEAASDLPLALGVAGVLGLLVWGGLLLLGRRRTRSAVGLPAMLGPAVAATVFTVAAFGCAVLAASDAVVLATWGTGLYWSAAGTCAVAAVTSALLLIRAMPASYTDARTVAVPAAE